MSASAGLDPVHSGTYAATAGDRTTDRRAWERAMERAQMEAWLSHEVIGRTAQVATSGAAPAVASLVGGLSHPVALAPPTPLAGTPVPSARPLEPGEPADAAPGESRRDSRTAVRAGYPHTEPGPGPEMQHTNKGGLMQDAATLVSNREGVPRRVGGDGVAHDVTPAPLRSMGPATLVDVLRPFRAVLVETGQAGATRAYAASPALRSSTDAPNPPTAGADVPFPQGVPPRAIEGSSSAPVARSPMPPGIERVTGRAHGEPAQDPVRVHAEWSSEGVRIWLGVDHQAIDTLLPLTAQLHRWLSSQGHRLISLHCNGQQLDTHIESHVAIPEATASAAFPLPTLTIQETP